MSDTSQGTPNAETTPAEEVPRAPLPPTVADPFAVPLSDTLGKADEDDEEEDDGAELVEPGPERPSSSAAAPSSSKRKVPGRGGGGGPKMRRGQVERISKAKGPKTTPTEWAELMRAEARKACEAAGVPLDEAGPVDHPAAGEPATSDGGAAPAEGEGSTSPSGHRFSAAPAEDLIFGQPAAQVLEAVPLTGGFWSMVAERCKDSRWDFGGERQMEVFTGTPFARTIYCNSERRLAELSAVLLVKHGSKVTGRVDTPEALFAGTLFFAFGPQALQNAVAMAQKVGGWWRRRRGGE